MTDHLSSLVNINTLQILEKIDEKPISLNEISKQFEEQIENLDETIQTLLKYGWLKEKDSEIYLPDMGKKKLILLRVIFEQDSTDSLYEMFKSQIYQQFKLVLRQHLTNLFFEEIDNNKPEDMEKILICSPWVSLTEKQMQILLNLKRQGIGIFIIIKPIEGTKEQTLNTHNFFLKNNFNLYYHKKLHSKLYIIQKNNYKNTAIFGSENLTNAKHEELGMIINDRDFTEVLIDYFYNLQGNSKPSRSH